MTFEDYEVMSVSFMVSEEEILAMGGIYFLPVLESKFYCRERRMVMCLIFNSVIFKKTVYLLYLFVCHGDLCKAVTKIQIFLITFVLDGVVSPVMMCMAERKTVWDPLRKKEVALTPEEEVRQWCIKVLSADLEIPLHMMMSEAALKLGEKKFRADVLVYDRSARPLMVVECKRPDVSLTQEVLDQAVRYNMVLNVDYIMITNGTDTYICSRGEGGRYSFVSKVPKYSEMICR